MEVEDNFDDRLQDWIGIEDEDIDGSGNHYLQALKDQSQLKILQRGRVDLAFKNKGKLGLFHLFLTGSWLDTIRVWTNRNLSDKGIKECNDLKFDAYLGLEMGMSIVQLN